MKKFFYLILLALSVTTYGQPSKVDDQLQLLGTRSWIRVNWNTVSGVHEYRLYWSANGTKPKRPGVVLNKESGRFYIENVHPETTYKVWVDLVVNGAVKSSLFGVVKTQKNWVLDPKEVKELQTNPTSVAVPHGMQLYWHDEFNDEFLNRNKWFTTYYSTIDYLRKENFDALLHDSLPEAAYKLNGHYIDLFVNDSLPLMAFSGGKKISSIQTYNWSTNENLLDNSRGGYFEVRVRRGSTGKPKGLNTAFWFDSPGPDLKYYLPEGALVNSTEGIRPKGQLFEIDMFENLDAQFVMHGRVDSNGRFIHNLATDIAQDYQPKKYVPGEEWVTFGLLWTPTSITHYINGKLVKAYDNKNHIYSPNHFMNVLLGSYGKGGTVNMEVDYIRYYTWPLAKGNELPNGGAELSSEILPWEGTATISSNAKRSGKNGFLLEPHQTLAQYVYLNNSRKYELKFWAKGTGSLKAEVNNIKDVSGDVEDSITSNIVASSQYSEEKISFKTGTEYDDNMKTIKISFTNTGNAPFSLDDIRVYQEKK